MSECAAAPSIHCLPSFFSCLFVTKPLARAACRERKVKAEEAGEAALQKRVLELKKSTDHIRRAKDAEYAERHRQCLEKVRAPFLRQRCGRLLRSRQRVPRIEGPARGSVGG